MTVETIFQFKRSPGSLAPTTLKFGEPAWVEEANTLYIGKADETVVGIPFGMSYQPLSSRLNELAALSPTNGSFLVGNGSSFVLQSGASARSLLGLGSAAIASTTDFVSAAEKGVAGGVATLDGTGRVPASQLTAPNIPVASVFGRLGAVTAQSGDYTAAQVGALAIASNLGDLASVATARVNLGLGTAAIVNTDSLLDRVNHTGTQAISTIAGLETALNNKLSGSELDDHISAPILDHPDGSVTDIKIGNRTVSDVAAPTNLGPGSLTQWFGWLVNRVKSITGKANWWETPATTLEATASHLANTSNPHNVTAAQIGAIAAAEKGIAGGVATLDGAGKVPTAQIPPIAINETFPVDSEAEMLALTAEVGDFAVRLDNLRTFILRLPGPSTLSNWQEVLTPTSGVTSVFGRIGVIGAQPGDYTADQVGALAIANDLNDLNSPSTARNNLGLGSLATKSSLLAADIPNLDAAKITTGIFADGQIPASIARDSEVQSAVSAKIDATEKGAAGGVATLDGTGKVPTTQLPELGAVQSVFGRVGAVGAESGDYDTDQVVEGATNLYFTAARSRTALAATGPLAYEAATGTFSIPAATSTQDGYLSSADKSKLDGIATGATANQGTVTSVALSVPSDLTVTGSPITTNGTLAVTRTDQVANQVMASPDGAAGVPTYRALVSADIPNIPSTKLSDSTATGRSVLTGDPAAGRTALALGTIATQNSDAVAITGGAINGTAIGAVSASTAKFTTGAASTSLAVEPGTNLKSLLENQSLRFSRSADGAYVAGIFFDGANRIRLNSRSDFLFNAGFTNSDTNTVFISTNGTSAKVGIGGLSNITRDTMLAVNGSVSIGTGSFTTSAPPNGLLVSGDVAIASTTASMSTTTGAVTIPSGGLAVGGAVYVGDRFVVQSAAANSPCRITVSGTSGTGRNVLTLGTNNFSNTWAGLGCALDGADGGDGSPQFRFYGADRILAFRNNFAEVFRITSGNLIGIGTTTPGAKLQITGGLAVASTTAAATDPGVGNMAIAGTLRIGSYTTATLPAAGTAGREAYATDARWSGGIGCIVQDNGSIWITPDGVQASASGYQRTITADRSLDRTDRIIWASTAAIAITLPAVSTNKYVPYRIRNISAGAITIAATGTDTVEGAASISLAAGNAYDLENDGTSAWRIM